jgi:uncharacterized protein YlzI (FlbEa/FlbD family)
MQQDPGENRGFFVKIKLTLAFPLYNFVNKVWRTYALNIKETASIKILLKNCLTIKANYMKLIEFKAADNYGNEYKIFINPEHIESIYTVPNKSRIGIGLVSGNPVEVTHTLKEVTEKLGINIETTDYKRSDQEH